MKLLDTPGADIYLTLAVALEYMDGLALFLVAELTQGYEGRAIASR